MKRYCNILLLIPILLFGLINLSQGEEIFTASVDVNKLISSFKFKLESERHSIVIFGVQWKDKSQKNTYPLTALARGFKVDKGTYNKIYYEGKEDHDQLFGKEVLYKFGEGDISSLYIFIANTIPSDSSALKKELKPGYQVTILSNASNDFTVSGFIFGSQLLTFKRKDKDAPVSFSYPIQKGSIYYIGIWPLEDLTHGESQLKIPSRSDRSLANIKNLFPKIEGFKFIDR